MQNSLSSYFKKKEKLNDPPVNYSQEAPNFGPSFKRFSSQSMSQSQNKIEVRLEICSISYQDDINMNKIENRATENLTVQKKPEDSPKIKDFKSEKKSPQNLNDEEERDEKPQNNPRRETQSATSSVKKSSQTEKRIFQEDWKKMYIGLNYNQETGVMTCEICQKYSSISNKAQNIFVTGTNKKRVDVLDYHWKVHSGHQQAIIAMKDSASSKKVYEDIVLKNGTKNIALMKISYFLCQNLLSFNKFSDVTSLIFKQILPLILQDSSKNLEIEKHYENDNMCVQFVESISFVIERKVLENIKKSEYYSLLIDETMDISKKEQLIIYGKYFDSGKQQFRTSFLKVTPLQNQNGAQIFLTVKEYLSKNGLDIKKCMSFGCDGASNLTGYRKGVFSHLLKSNPFLILRHCANHRLALASADTKNDVKYINEYVDNISDIYSFFSRSARRNILLKKFQAETLEPELHVLKMCPTRWLSLSNCVKNMSKMLQSVVLTFDGELNSNDDKMTEES